MSARNIKKIGVPCCAAVEHVFIMPTGPEKFLKLTEQSEVIRPSMVALIAEVVKIIPCPILLSKVFEEEKFPFSIMYDFLNSSSEIILGDSSFFIFNFFPFSIDENNS